MITMSHNAKGCMRPWVTEKIWGSLKHREDMYCGLTKKPIIDLSIYTKNRNFKVPGSSKYVGFHQYPLPSRAFFMATRMADRLKPPDLKTEQLNLKGSMTIRSSVLNLKREKCKRKRQLTSPCLHKDKTKEMNRTLLNQSCRGDISKKRRVCPAKPNPGKWLKVSYAGGHKNTKTEAEVIATALLPEHLVNTTPGPGSYHPKRQSGMDSSNLIC